MSGALELSDGSDVGGGAGLVATTAYFVKCVTVSLDDDSSCISEVDSDGSFELKCPGFREQQFGCFIMQGTSSGGGEIAEDSLTIKGTITSEQLVMGPSTTNADLAIKFDPNSGVAEVNLQQKVVDPDTGAETLVDGSNLATKVPKPLQELSITSGKYEFCFSDLADGNTAWRGDFTNTDSTCSFGHRENLYVNFTAATTTKKPELEMWKTETDFNNCRTAAGDLKYHISDGSNVLTFSEANGIAFDTLRDAIINNGWTSQASIDQYTAAQSATSNNTFGISSDLDTLYPSPDYDSVCEGFIPDFFEILDDLLAAGKSQAWQACNFADNTSLSSEMKNILTSPEIPPHWCTEYIDFPTERTRLRDSAMTDCKVHIDKQAGEDLWAGHMIVNDFLWQLAETRHQTGKSMGGELAEVYENFVSAIQSEGWTADNNLHVNFTDDINYSVNLSDDLNKAFARAWADFGGEYNRAEALRCIADTLPTDNTTACDTTGVGFPRNARELLHYFLINPNPWDPGFATDGFSEIEQMICGATGPGNLDFANLTGAGQTAASNFLSKVKFFPEVSFDPNLSLTAAQKQSEWNSLINAFLDSANAGANPSVFGCTASRLTQIQNDIAMDPSFADAELVTVAMPLADRMAFDGIEAIDLSYTGGDPTVPSTFQTDLETIADAAAQWALDNMSHPEAGRLLRDICPLRDLSAVALNYDGAVVNITCDGTTQIPPVLHASYELDCTGTNLDACHFPLYDSDTATWDYKQRFNFLLNEINRIRGMLATMFDTSLAGDMMSIRNNSKCIPDANVSPMPVELNGTITFDVTIRSPVARKLAGKVNMDLGLTKTSTTPKFMVSSERLEEVPGGMNGESCYWGERQSFTKLTPTSNTLEGVFVQAWIDTCQDANFGGTNTTNTTDSTTSSTTNTSGDTGDFVWYTSVKGTKLP